MKLYTNRKEFYNDICEVVRLFSTVPVIELTDDGGFSFGERKLSACLSSSDGGGYSAKAEYFDGASAFSYAYSMPHAETEGTAKNAELTERAAFLEKKRLEKRCLKIAIFRAMKKAFPEAPLPWGSLTGIRPTSLLRD